MLVEEYIQDGETGAIIQMLRERQPLDLIYSHGNAIMSKITSIFTKNAIKLEQPGGSAIQMSNFGYDLGDDRGVAREIADLPEHIRNEIVWLQNENELKAARVEINNEKDGELEFKRAQVALPYSDAVKIFGDQWEEVKKLPPKEIAKRIDPKALQGVGYRIPNQKLASNDPIEIVAILPPTAGNTIVAYSAVTTKTGSDFDIDKMYYVLRPVRRQFKNGKIYVKAHEFLDETTTVQERAKALVSSTSEMGRVLSLIGYESKDVQNVVDQLNSWYEEFKLASDSKKPKLDTDLANNIVSKINRLKREQKKPYVKSWEAEDMQIEIDSLQFALVELAGEEEKILEKIKAERNNLVTQLVDKIKDFSIEQQNTKRALQSRRVDLYDAILTHPTSYLRLMSTVDADWLKDHIKMTLPNKPLTDLEFYTGQYHMEVRRQNIASKSGVGQVANHQVDHAISQWAGVHFKNINNRLGIGNTTADGNIDLSGKTVNQFQVIKAYDAEGNEIPSKELGDATPASYKLVDTVEDDVVITEVISAYMNAFVDAAKDNYIGKANFNSVTNNTAFLLLRAGVSPQFVNAFLSQPIIKIFVGETIKSEGQAVPINEEKPLKKVMQLFDLEKISDTSKLSDFKTIDMMNTILKTSDDSYLAYGINIDNLTQEELQSQGELLGLFLYFREASKLLRDSVLATKSDTGIGKSLFDAYITTNKKDNVLEMNSIGNFHNKFKKDGVTTMAGAFHKNGPAAAVEVIGKHTLLGTTGMDQFIKEAYVQLWGELPSDPRKIRKLYGMATASLLSYYTGFNMTEDELKRLNSGENSIANRVVALQQDEEYKDNFFVSMILSNVSYTGEISFVGINNAKPRNSAVNKQITDAWEELYEDPKHRQTAIDLAKYAFHSSATMDNLSSMYRLMPYRLAQELGLTTETIRNK
jgi:hypothetical protein